MSLFYHRLRDFVTRLLDLGDFVFKDDIKPDLPTFFSKFFLIKVSNFVAEHVSKMYIITAERVEVQSSF